MAKARTVYVCQACGTTHGRWSGQCTACGEWNTIAEEPVLQAVPKGNAAARSLAGGRLDVVPLHGEDEPLQRLITGIKEFDHVCGGGMVPGGCLLIGGNIYDLVGRDLFNILADASVYTWSTAGLLLALFINWKKFA